MTFIAGGVLVVVGVIAYVASGAVSLTALIPSGLGALLLVAAVIARNPKLRRHSMHVAMLVALIGIVATSMNTLRLGEVFAGTAERPWAVIASALTFVTLLVYLGFGIASFVQARRDRT
ncbi:MAG: hypothetical protein QM628_01810 [Propionicimonas sp.]